MAEPLSVLVTGIGGGGHGEQILKALRLGHRPYRIVGTDASPACANRGRVDHFATLPPAHAPDYLGALTVLAREHGCVAIFHGSEPELAALSKARSELEAQGFYVPVNPPELLATCQDKARTFDHLSACGFPVPACHEISALADLAAVETLPAVLKPSVGGGGSANVFIAQTRAELEGLAAHLLQHHEHFLVQEYIGTPEAEFTVGVLFGRDGTLITSIAIRRMLNTALTVRSRVPNRSGRPALGDTLAISSGVSQGHVADWPEVRRQCEAIATSLAPRAPVNIQCRLVDGAAVPFEINPRFSGTTSLRAMAGCNEPDLLIRRDVLGQRVEPGAPYRDVVILRSLEETIVDLGEAFGDGMEMSGVRH